jgi:hypothetical protein
LHLNLRYDEHIVQPFKSFCRVDQGIVPLLRIRDVRRNPPDDQDGSPGTVLPNFRRPEHAHSMYSSDVYRGIMLPGTTLVVYTLLLSRTKGLEPVSSWQMRRPTHSMVRQRDREYLDGSYGVYLAPTGCLQTQPADPAENHPVGSVLSGFLVGSTPLLKPEYCLY